MGVNENTAHQHVIRGIPRALAPKLLHIRLKASGEVPSPYSQSHYDNDKHCLTEYRRASQQLEVESTPYVYSVRILRTRIREGEVEDSSDNPIPLAFVLQ